MVVHHHQVRRERVPARAHHEAVPVVGTLLPEAVVARRRGVRPDRRVLGDVGQVGAIAGRGHGGKALDAMQLRNFLPRGEAAFARRALHAVEAYIVRASLQQRRRGAAGECFAHRGKIAVVQLVLQRFRPRRDDHLAAGEQRRDQVGEGLAGAGARLGDEHAGPLDRGVDGRGHLELLGPQPESGDARGERPVGCESSLQRAVQFPISSTFTQTRRVSEPRDALADPMPRSSREPASLTAPSANHSPSGPLTVLTILCVSRWEPMSIKTLSPATRGATSKPVPMSCITMVSCATTPAGVWILWRCISGLDCPVVMKARPPSRTTSRWSTRSAAADRAPCARTSTREPPPPILPPASMLWLAASSESSKRTEICRRRSGRSIASSARLISARFAGLARTMSCPDCPVRAPPGSTSGCNAGSTWSTVRCRNGMISRVCWARLCTAQPANAVARTVRTSCMRFIFMDQRASRRCVYQRL